MKIQQRNCQQELVETLIQEGLDPVLARVIAARPFPEKWGTEACLSPRLGHLDAPDSMQDMDKAVNRLIKAISENEVIGIETDHDCDGQTAHAVLYSALTEIFGVKPERIRSYIGHRLQEGYGLSEALKNRILEDSPRPNLIITADNGSSDETQISKLSAEGIDVIVTDHHQLPEEGPPKSAYAVLNPTREDCDFPDDLIAGCMVAWLFMAKARSQLSILGHLKSDAPSLKNLLDFVAVGTVADCVSMARSANNRAVVKFGLSLINQAKRPCWQALLPLLNRRKFRAEDLGFLVGPLLNSDGRLSDAFGSVNFLLSKDLKEAEPWARQLVLQNESRKKIQKRITEESLVIGAQQVSLGHKSLVIALKEGHAGVHGISASRIKDKFGRPTILFSRKDHEPEYLFGSARSIDGVHIREALARAKSLAPESILKFGGHRGAAGLTIPLQSLSAFHRAFEMAVAEQVGEASLGPILWTDGELPLSHFSLEFVDCLMKLDPYGREFETAVFEGNFRIQSLKWLGQTEPVHLSLLVELKNQKVLKGIWFNAEPWAKTLKAGDCVHGVFSLSDSEFQGERQLQILMSHLTLQPL